MCADVLSDIPSDLSYVSLIFSLMFSDVPDDVLFDLPSHISCDSLADVFLMFFLMFVPFNDPSDVLCEAPAKLSDVSLMFSLMLKFPLSFRLKLLRSLVLFHFYPCYLIY